VPTISTPFDPTTVARSQTLHMDYTGRLQTICTSGTQYLQIACWGHYIYLQPLTSMRSAQTTQAFTNSVNFFRKLGICLTQLRMDNQWSEDLRDVAVELDMHIEFISTEAKRANRAERAIRTAKNHIVATRAGFHPDFSHAFLDKCLPQMKLALNVIHPFEYDNNVSAYEGLHRAKFDFKRHPIAPLGCKVLAWDAPENRGSWADHGIEGMYIGPALNHFRSFNIWIPSTSALRIANTVWWFMAPIKPSQEFLQLDLDVAYPPTRNRPVATCAGYCQGSTAVPLAVPQKS
jgi:hypothetical protein